MTNKKEALISQLNRAVNRLEKALEQQKDEFVRNSAIQRFEFCFDLSWKSIKTFLEDDRGILRSSPKG